LVWDGKCPGPFEEYLVASADLQAYLTDTHKFRRTTVAAISFPATLSRPFALAAAVVALLLAGTLGLWAYYGTAIFFEMVRAGWAACF
jgi:hypothetical protein